MRIPAITFQNKNTFKTNNVKSFKGEIIEDEDEKEYKTPNITYTQEEYDCGINQSKQLGIGIGAGAAILIGIIGLITSLGGAKYKSAKDTKNIKTIINDPNIRKDKYRVEDLNNDNVPEIIFEKKDGTEIALDITKQKLYNLSETTKMEEIK